MSETSEDHEVVARWERKRWADFKENLSKVSESNQFQQKHLEAFYSLDEWDCFADFLIAISLKSPAKLIPLDILIIPMPF